MFYHSIKGQMQEIRQSIGQSELPFPRCFYGSDDEGVIVMENLKKQGYSTVPKSPEGTQEHQLQRYLAEF